jgi:hypothetical protein
MEMPRFIERTHTRGLLSVCLNCQAPLERRRRPRGKSARFCRDACRAAYARKMGSWIVGTWDAADIAEVDIRTVQRAVGRGELKAIPWSGRSLIFRGIDVIEWAKRRRIPVR